MRLNAYLCVDIWSSLPLDRKAGIIECRKHCENQTIAIFGCC